MTKIIQNKSLPTEKGIERVKAFGLNAIESVGTLLDAKPEHRRLTGNFLMTLVREFREVSQDWKTNKILIDAEIKDLDKNEIIALILIWGCEFSRLVLKINNIELEHILTLIGNDDITKIAIPEKETGKTTTKSSKSKSKSENIEK